MVLVLNFSGHRLTKGVKAATESLLGAKVEVHELSRQLDLDNLVQDVEKLVRTASVPAEVWQEQEVFVLPPTLGAAAAVLCAHLHGLLGAFPRLIWLKLDPESGLYTVPVVLDLPAVRTRGRQDRFER